MAEKHQAKAGCFSDEKRMLMVLTYIDSTIMKVLKNY
jgi:hypothetical protein